RAGRRFRAHYREHQQRAEPRWRGALLVCLGLLMILIGTLLGLVPGAPGIVLVIPGVALIVARLRFTAYALDRADIALIRLWCRLRSRQSGKDSRTPR